MAVFLLSAVSTEIYYGTLSQLPLTLRKRLAIKKRIEELSPQHVFWRSITHSHHLLLLSSSKNLILISKLGTV